MEKRIDGWGRLGRRGRWKKGSLLGLLDWIRKPNMGREREMKASKSEWQIWIDKAQNKLIWGSGLKHKRTNKKLDLGRTCSLPLKGNSTTLAIQSWELWEIFKTPLLLEPRQGHCCLFDGQGQGDILHTSLGTAGTMRGDRHKRRKGRQKTWCWVTAADRRVWAHHVTAGDSLNARWGGGSLEWVWALRWCFYQVRNRWAGRHFSYILTAYYTCAAVAVHACLMKLYTFT